MSLSESILQAFINNDTTTLQQELSSIPPNDRYSTCHGLLEFALSTENFTSLLFSLIDLSPNLSDLIYVNIQNSEIPLYTDIIRKLLAVGLCPNFHPSKNTIPLLTDAIERNILPLVFLLVDEGATIDEERYPDLSKVKEPVMEVLKGYDTSRLGMPLTLHFCAKYNNLPLVERFLDEGHDINQIPEREKFLLQGDLGTPLHYAVQGYHQDGVLLLLDRGADATLKDRSGRNVLERSMKLGVVWPWLEKVLADRNVEL